MGGMNKKISGPKLAVAGALILAVLVVSGCVQQPSGGEAPKSYSISEVALHSSEADCWLAISGKVYNVTAMIPNHPGGKAILQGCGKDATDLFETRPMGSGTPHSQNARTFAANYLIGDLKA